MFPDYTEAYSILGKGFITANQIMAACDVTYTEDQRIAPGKSLPEATILKKIRNAGMMLVAGPPTAMSMLDVRALHTDYYPAPYRDGCDWYNSTTTHTTVKEFATADKVEAVRWIALRKEPIDGSLWKSLEAQQRLVAKPLYIPNAAEVTWGLTTYKAVNGVYLLDDVFVRTSSRFRGYRVVVGFRDVKGFAIGFCHNKNDAGPLGILAAQKF